MLADAINMLTEQVTKRKLSARIVLHVHDEIVIEAKAEDAKDVQTLMEEVFSSPPMWADGLPLIGDSFISEYYKKG